MGNDLPNKDPVSVTDDFSPSTVKFHRHEVEVDACLTEHYAFKRLNNWSVAVLQLNEAPADEHCAHRWYFKDNPQINGILTLPDEQITYGELTYTEHLWSCKIKLAPLHTHTLPLLKHERLRQLMHYYSSSTKTSFLVLLTTHHIYKYDIALQHWLCAIKLPSYLSDASATIDNRHHKMYLVSPYVSSLFDLESHKWNLVKSHQKRKQIKVDQLLLRYADSNRNPSRVPKYVRKQQTNDVITWTYLDEGTETHHKGIKCDMDGTAESVNVWEWGPASSDENEKTPSNYVLEMKNIKSYCTNYTDFEYDYNLKQMFKASSFHVFALKERHIRHFDGMLWCVIPYHSDRMFQVIININGSRRYVHARCVKMDEANARWRKFGKWKIKKYIQAEKSNISTCLIEQRFFVLLDYRSEGGWLIIIDLSLERFFVREQGHGLNLSFNSKPVMAYDEVEGKAHFINESVQHYSLRYIDLIPRELLARELVYGFIREFEFQHACNVLLPLCLWDLVLWFYAVVED